MRSPKQVFLGNLSTSEKEIKDLLKAWTAISVAFAIALSGSFFSAGFYKGFVVASLTVGVGFLLHETGHKILAQKYGCFAEFRSFDNMLILAIVMSFFGVVFAAPGAVMISGYVSKSKSGKISAAGPLVNIGLALGFLALIFLELPPIFQAIGYYGFIINSMLALFNMIPFWLFDGYKILQWSKLAYSGIVAAALALVIVRFFIPVLNYK